MTVPLWIVGLILFAAFCNASWNVFVKRGTDRLLSVILVSLGCGLIAAAVLPFLTRPDPASWPFIAASVLAQIVYMILLAATYTAGDMSQTYPVMRGVAPLLVALASGPIIGEGLSAGRWMGVALISAGVGGMALVGPTSSPRSWRAPGLAVLNAAVIASYTIIDGLGVRRSGAPVAYAFTTFVLTALPLVGWAAVFRGRRFVDYAVAQWRVVVIGGAGTLVSYTLALWAMTVAPVAVIASLRETSILFAAVLSVVVLKERIVPARLASIALIVLGAAAIRAL